MLNKEVITRSSIRLKWRSLWQALSRSKFCLNVKHIHRKTTWRTKTKNIPMTSTAYVAQTHDTCGKAAMWNWRLNGTNISQLLFYPFFGYLYCKTKYNKESIAAIIGITAEPITAWSNIIKYNDLKAFSWWYALIFVIRKQKICLYS